jgi:hypothetical protein
MGLFMADTAIADSAATPRTENLCEHAAGGLVQPRRFLPDAVADALDLSEPRIDRPAVEAALERHFRGRGKAVRPLRWFADVAAAEQHVNHRDAAREMFACPAYPRGLRLGSVLDAAWTAARNRHQMQTNMAVGFAAVSVLYNDIVRNSAIPERFIALLAQLERGESTTVDEENWLPGDDPPMSPAIIDAFANGLLRYWVTPAEIVCVPRPGLWVANGRLHRTDGPAVEWESGARFWFWRGQHVEQWVVENPDRIGAGGIMRARTSSWRQCLLDRFGVDRFLGVTNARLLGADRYGKLWRLDGGETMVEVENGTPEPDGTRRRFLLQVPPEVATAHEAVAWTFGLPPARYAEIMRT